MQIEALDGHIEFFEHGLHFVDDKQRGVVDESPPAVVDVDPHGKVILV